MLVALCAFSLRASALERTSGPLKVTDRECQEIASREGYPEYYCECLNHSLPFHYGLDTVIQGVNWYVASLNQVAAGFSAYWFGDSQALVEGFVSCGQDTATMEKVIGSNVAFHADLGTLLNKLGAGAMTQLGSVPLHVRVTQLSGVEGRLVVMPYDKGPVSTCLNPLPVITEYPYVVSDPDNVYLADPASSRSRLGKAMRWMSKRNDSVVVTLTRGACNGPVMAQYVLTDSTHVWFYPQALQDDLAAARRAKDSVYVHLSTGTRMSEAMFINNLEVVNDTVDTVACLGTFVRVGDLRISSDTSFCDTIYAYRDTARYLEDGQYNANYQKHYLLAQYYNIHFEAPQLEYDTIHCHADELGFNYLGMRTQPINAFGDYSIYYRRTGECDRDIRLHVEEILYPQILTVDTTLCQGMRLRVNNVNYTTDTVFEISEWRGKQEIVTTYYVHFTAPELEKDTVYIHADSLPYYYDDIRTSACRITAYGTKTLTITVANQCTRKVQLTTVQLWYNDTVRRDTTICTGKTLVLPNVVSRTADVVTTMSSDNTTHHYVNWYVTYAEPETVQDSLSLHISRLPYSYYGHRLTHFGDTTLYVQERGECDRYVQLHLDEFIHPIDTTWARVDTTICTGMTFTLHDSVYSEATQLVDTFWTNEYSILFTTLNLAVTPILERYDTVRLLASQMPYQYMERELATFGAHQVEVHAEGECDQVFYIQLIEKPVCYDTTRIDTSLCVGLVFYAADTFALSSTQFVRSYWSKGNDTCYTTSYNVHFESLPAQQDTFRLLYSELPFNYEAYPGGKLITGYGSQRLTHQQVGECVETYEVTVLQRWERDTTVVVDTVCAGGVEQHYQEQVPQNAQKSDSIHLIIYNIYVADPELAYDTVRLEAHQLPYSYEGTMLTADKADYLIVKRDEHGCEVHWYVHLDVYTALNEVETRKNGWRKFVVNGQLYIEHDGVVYDVTGRRL